MHIYRRKSLSAILTILIISICGLLISNLCSCSFINEPIREFFKEYTETAAIEKIEFTKVFPKDNAGIISIPSGTNQTINFHLRNPQNYNLVFDYKFNNENVTGTKDTDYSFVLDAKSHTFLTLSLNDTDFLKKYDKDPATHDISGRITIIEPATGRKFDAFPINLRVNSVPPVIERATFQTDKDASESDCQYVVCFFMPVFDDDSVHKKDTTTFLINGKPRYFAPGNSTSLYKEKDPADGSLSNPDTAFSVTKPALVPLGQGEAIISFDETKTPESIDGISYTAVYYSTGIHPNDTETIFSFSLVDDAGLSASTAISNKAKKLTPPAFQDGTLFTADEDSGYFEYKIIHNELATDGSDTGKVYINSTFTDGTNKTSDKQFGSSTLNLKPGVYEINAYASKDNFVSSDTTSVSEIKICRPAIYYVSEDGDDTEGLGSKQKPFATIQKAISEIDNNTDIDGDTQVYIRLMSDIQVSDTIEFSATTLSSDRAKNIIMEPYGISNAKISLGGINDKGLISENLLTVGVKLTLNNLTLENGCTEANASTESLIYSGTNNSLIMNNVTIQNSAVKNLARIVDATGNIEMKNCTVKNCISEKYLVYGNNLTINNSSITGNKANNIVYNKNQVVIKDSTVSDNTCSSGAIISTEYNKNITIGGKVIIKNNKNADGVQKNLAYNHNNSTCSIKIDSPLTGSDIHVYYSGGTSSAPATYGNPQSITSGYSSFNSVNPATFFTDDSGYIIGWNDAGTEATLHVSAAAIEPDFYDNIEVRCGTSILYDPSVISDVSGRTVSFKVYDKSTGTDVTDKANLKFTVKYLGSSLGSEYVTKKASSVVFNTNVGIGFYYITVEATVNGTKYISTHPIEIKEIPLATELPSVPNNNAVFGIASQADMEQLAVWVEGQSRTYTVYLLKDITLSGFSTISRTSGTKSFTGSFDGNGHTITVTNVSQYYYQGLFYNLGDNTTNTTIKNLTMDGTVYVNGDIGGFVTTCNKKVSIENCVNKMNITSNNKSAAGFCNKGNAQNKPTIINCLNVGNIEGLENASGIANEDFSIYNCKNTGNVSGKNAGGITYNGTAINCVNRGHVKSKMYNAGGIAGRGVSVINCINYGTVDGKGDVGGIYGNNAPPQVKNCVNLGIVENSSGGAIVGSYGQSLLNVENNYFNSAVNEGVPGIGSEPALGAPYAYPFTTNGYASSVNVPATVGTVTSQDVVALLNEWVKQNPPAAGAPAYSKWTYDEDGLPKLMCEE